MAATDATAVGHPSQYAPAPSLAEFNAGLCQDQWPSFVACPICGETDVRLLSVIRYVRHDRCRECGFTFANPYPPEAICSAFYDSPFYTNYRRLEARRRRQDPYFSASAYRNMRALVRLMLAHSPQNILDYGCGTGSFVALIREEFGFPEVEGIEISSEARAYASREYGIEIAANPEELRHTAYDFVALLEVIEHVPDPAAFFAEVVPLVRPGGYIMITTPSVDNYVGRYLPKHCMHYTAPSHVSLFTGKALSMLLETFSFRVVQWDTDIASGSAHTAARSALYHLDFASPQHDDDTNDALYRPTSLGRLLRRQNRRPAPPPRLVSKPLSLIDRTLERFASHPNHLYVIAERPAR